MTANPYNFLPIIFFVKYIDRTHILLYYTYEQINICLKRSYMREERFIMGEGEEKDFLAARDDVVKKVLEQQPDDEILYDLAELFKVFGDSTRIKILYSMFETELCVNDIAKLLNLSQSSVSHQLRILKSSKLVKFRREGKSIFYSLDDEHVRAIISMGMEHVEE